MHASPAARLPACPYGREETALLLEATDAQDRPLALLPVETVLRQRLFFRMAAVAPLYADGSLLLLRRSVPLPEHQGKWDLLCCPVFAGESREDAALRILCERLPQGAHAAVPAALTVRRADGEFHAHITLFAAILPDWIHPGGDALRADADELEGLARDTPELFTPELLWATETGALFSKREKAARTVARSGRH